MNQGLERTACSQAQLAAAAEATLPYYRPYCRGRMAGLAGLAGLAKVQFSDQY